MQINLTDNIIRNYIKKCNDSRISLTDKKVQGLSVEVRRSSATFYLRTAYQKRSKRITLGKFPVLSVADARKLCAEHKRQFIIQVHEGVLNTNVDMRFDIYYEQHFLPWCKVYKRTYSSHQSMYKNHLKKRFGKIILSDLSTPYIFAFVNDLSARGYNNGFINKCVQHLRSALNRAEELCGADTHASIRKSFTQLRTVNRKERYLDAAESTRLRDYIDAHRRDAVCLLLGLLMYTGARRHEVFAAEWQHINLANGSWYVPVTKNGKPRYVMLNRSAQQIIEYARELQAQRYSHKPQWVFINPRTHKPYRCVFSKWSRIRTELGLDDVRIHDLRHSFASTLVNNGATLYEVQKLLGHSRSATTERYAHLANHRLQQAAGLIDKAFE
ncbi:tyrosine-type recombinase/integrase [Nereida sp. NH-UV-3]|uniref:tyrosine-type recombinase/integrase n=1 Tax=Nereida TaxID=282198 RepID=UPI0036F339BB